MSQGFILFLLLAFLLGSVVSVAAFLSYYKKDGAKSARGPEATIEERVAEISEKISQIEKLKAIASSQGKDPLIKDLVEKHDMMRRYLMDYLDRYEAQLLRVRYEAILEACKHRDRIDEVVEAKDLIGIEKRSIESESKATVHAALEGQYAEILREIDEIIKLSLVNSTRNILAQESPIQRNARLISLDLSPVEATSAEAEIEALNRAYDNFIAETQV